MFSRCDHGLFSTTGCRPEYGCTTVPRANENDVESGICLPGEGDPVDDCIQALIDANIDFEIASIPDRSPDDAPELTCHVENPVTIHPPFHGVDFVYYNGDATPNIRVSCEAALAIVDTAADFLLHDVDKVRHIGTYACRKIAGTNRLSNHASGDAIDIWGFDMNDGSLITLEDHWEHDTEAPVADEAVFLYDAGNRWHEAHIWNTILTPNFNDAHDNHFHVDLTPDTWLIHSLGVTNGYYYGPAPYGD
ncbi:MAG: extensin family protein [Deltaproteobacteria bacterium]|nr:extensin family protein [Deltaproteobacteria bacterium]